MAFDPAEETARYIDGLGSEALEKAANYTLGNHWMLIWSLLVTAIATWIIVRWGILDRLSTKLEKRGWAMRTWLISTVFFLISSLLTLPWAIYQDYWREKHYGNSDQPLADFLGQSAISLAISTILTGLFFLGVYALIRRAGNRWWLWSGVLATAAGAFLLLLSPILIEPLFNDYKPVPAGPVRTALLKMADEAKIPHDRIFMYDGSRQSNNFTANVSGVLGSARIAISDVALKEASLDEVKAVTGHEIGHYVLNHVWFNVGMLAFFAICGLFFVDRLFPRFAGLFGSSAKIGDVNGLPILMFTFTLFGMLAQPVINAGSRHFERQSDDYSLQTVNLPDALSAALVKTAEYRYPRPSPLQEALFYTHPSVEWRVRNAMNWKAQHLPKDGDARP